MSNFKAEAPGGRTVKQSTGSGTHLSQKIERRLWAGKMATDGENHGRPTLEKLGLDESTWSPTVLPWDRFSKWLQCACVVTFDLELGQAMELIYPGHVKLTEREKMNICYLSFPDSNSGCMGDTQFHFRIRQCPGRRPGTLSHEDYNRECPAALQTDSGYYYGYVYFRQTKDRSIRRGYFQKSVVLMSRLPFTNLFTHLVGIVAPEYFENGEPCLEAACHDIDQWLGPTPGDTLNLPIMGSVLQVRIPCRADKLIGISQIRTQPVPQIPANNILPSLHEVDLFSAFQPVLPHVQMLWELVITGEPIVVMAALPTVSAMTVQALVSMIWPLRFSSDYRPYFTIHDSEFKEYTTKTQAPPSVVLGVTNPFFAKTLQHWPHIVRIGEMTGASPKFNKLKKGGNLKTLDSKPVSAVPKLLRRNKGTGVYTRYKPFLNKDKTVLKRLAKRNLLDESDNSEGVQTKRPVEVQNAMLKRYLLELTQSFMIPLERYVASLMPLQRNISPHKGPPRLKPFDTEEFLKTADHSGPQLTSGLKGDWLGLYRRFFRSANFESWLKLRTAEVNQKLQALHAEALCKADLMTWIQDKQEVEIVDLILRLRDKLASAEAQQIPLTDEMVTKLQRHLDTIIATLPNDLQSVLKST